MNEWSKKRSIMKMLGSSKATSKFRDDLNQLDRVIKALDTCVGTDTNLAVHNNAEKLDALLEKANITTSEEPKDEFQILFNRLKAGAGHEKGVMSCLLDDSFVTSFESVFLDDDDIEDEETKEALLRTLDKNDDGDITEAEFKKFYKKFLKSGVGMAEYLKVVKNEDAEKQAAIQKAEEEEEERQRREEEEEERRWQAEQNNDDTAGATTAPSTAAATTSAPTGFYIAVKCAEGEKITASWNVQYPKSSDYIALVQEGNSEENYVTYEYNSGASKKGELAIDASGSCSRGMKYFLSYINGDTYKKADGVANSRLFKLFDEDSKLKPKAKKKVKEVVRVKSIDFNRINVQWKVNDPVSDYDYIELVDDGGNSCTYAYNTNKANEVSLTVVHLCEQHDLLRFAVTHLSALRENAGYRPVMPCRWTREANVVYSISSPTAREGAQKAQNGLGNFRILFHETKKQRKRNNLYLAVPKKNFCFFSKTYLVFGLDVVLHFSFPTLSLLIVTVLRRNMFDDAASLLYFDLNMLTDSPPVPPVPPVPFSTPAFPLLTSSAVCSSFKQTSKLSSSIFSKLLTFKQSCLFLSPPMNSSKVASASPRLHL